MKHKKIIIFMIILSTLIACCNMIISAENVWEDTNGLYEVDTFTLLEEIRYIAENSIDIGDDYNIYANNIFLLYQPHIDIEEYVYKTLAITYSLDNNYWYIYIIIDQSTSIQIQYEDFINEYTTVYISEKFYNEIEEHEYGNSLPWENIVYVPKAKEVFEGTLETANYIVENAIKLFYYENNITFFGWIALISISIPIIINIIKLITNSIRR